MAGWKWLWNWTAPIAAGLLWTLGAATVGEKSFSEAQWLFLAGNVILATRIILAPQIDAGQRNAIIAFTIIVSLGFSGFEWAWVNGRRAAALSAAAIKPSSTSLTILLNIA